MLDMEKILTQPDEDARGEEILRQLLSFLSEIEPKDRAEALAGAVSSIVLQNLNMAEYLNAFVTTFNMLVTTIQAPFQMLTFPDWLETKDMTTDQRKEWVNEKNLAFQKRQRKIKLLNES